MKIDRLLSIIVILLNEDNVTAKELADRFEVSTRTIYRDIETINMSGIPILSNQGRYGGFSILENYKISHQLLTLDDMVSIVAALRNIGNFAQNNDVDLTIDKISGLVPKDKKEEFNYYFSKMIIYDLPWGYRINPKDKDKFQLLNEAIIEERLFNIEYRDSYGSVIQRNIEPMSLVLKGFNWYVFAYCHLREDYRFFRLSRIYKIKALDERFIRREMTYEDFKERSNSNYNMVELILKFSPEVSQRVADFFYEEDTIIDENGYKIVKVSYPEDEWVYSMILSYGEYVEVVEPLHIKNIIKKKARKIYEKY